MATKVDWADLSPQQARAVRALSPDLQAGYFAARSCHYTHQGAAGLMRGRGSCYTPGHARIIREAVRAARQAAGL